MIKVWSFDFIEAPGRNCPDLTDSSVVQATYDFHMENLAKLEGVGFTGVFLSEHHFCGLTPNPNLFLAALAQRTRTLRLGVMGNVLPFHQPYRLAEDLAMMNYLTHGRYEIGVANGAGPGEPVILGLDLDAVRPMSAEAMDIIAQAQSGRSLDYDGKYFKYSGVPIVPPTCPTAHRRIWQTVMSEASAQAAIRRNFKICSGFMGVNGLKTVFDAYRAEADRLGVSVGPDDLAIRRRVLIRRDAAEAEALGAELKEKQMIRVAATLGFVRGKVHDASTNGIASSGVIDAASPGSTNPFMIADENIIGTPSSVAEQIAAQCDATGAGHFLGYHFSAMTQEETTEHYALWGQVIAQLNCPPSAPMAQI